MSYSRGVEGYLKAWDNSLTSLVESHCAVVTVSRVHSRRTTSALQSDDRPGGPGGLPLRSPLASLVPPHLQKCRNVQHGLWHGCWEWAGCLLPIPCPWLRKGRLKPGPPPRSLIGSTPNQVGMLGKASQLEPRTFPRSLGHRRCGGEKTRAIKSLSSQ